MNAPALELIKTGTVWTAAAPAESRFAFEQLANLIANRREQTAQALYDVGIALIEAKASLEHGRFTQFLADPRVSVEPRVAQNMMAMARQDDGPQLAGVGIAKATLLIQGLTLDARRALMSDRDVVAMSVSQVRSLLHPPRPPRQRRTALPAPRPSAREAGFIEGYLAAKPDAQLEARDTWAARGK